MFPTQGGSNGESNDGGGSGSILTSLLGSSSGGGGGGGDSNNGEGGAGSGGLLSGILGASSGGGNASGGGGGVSPKIKCGNHRKNGQVLRNFLTFQGDFKGQLISTLFRIKFAIFRSLLSLFTGFLSSGSGSGSKF